MKIRDSDSTALSHRAGPRQSQEVAGFKVETPVTECGLCVSPLPHCCFKCLLCGGQSLLQCDAGDCGEDG